MTDNPQETSAALSQEADILLSLSYSVSREEQEEALDAEFRVKRSKRLLVLTGAALLVSILLIQMMLVSPSSRNAGTGIMVCFLLGASMMQWVFQGKKKRELLDLMEELRNDVYACRVSGEMLEIRTVKEGEENPPEPTTLWLGGQMVVAETPHAFAIMPGRELIYVLPKKALDRSSDQILREVFHKRLGKRLKMMKQA